MVTSVDRIPRAQLLTRLQPGSTWSMQVYRLLRRKPEMRIARLEEVAKMQKTHDPRS